MAPDIIPSMLLENPHGIGLADSLQPHHTLVGDLILKQFVRGKGIA